MPEVQAPPPDPLITDSIARLMDHVDRLSRATMFLSERLDETMKRLTELETLWRVARENPELVRELAAEVLKGRDAR